MKDFEHKGKVGELHYGVKISREVIEKGDVVAALRAICIEYDYVIGELMQLVKKED